MKNGSGWGNKISSFSDIAISRSRLISRQMARTGIAGAPFKQCNDGSSARSHLRENYL